MKPTENEEMKRLINSRLWYCISQKTTVRAIESASGITRQTFYNIRDNSRMPHTDTVLAVKQSVPDLNMEMLYSADESLPMESLFEKTAATGSSAKKDGIDWEAKYHDLESKVNGIVETMTQKYNDLMDKFSLLENQKNFMEKVLRRVDPTLFSESDSHITVFPLPRVAIGFVQQSTECIVRMHPATADQLHMLDSLAPVAGAQG